MRATAACASAASGARPRLVWTITPVALSTRRSEALLAAREALARAGDEVGLVVRARPQLRPPLVDHRARRGDRQRVRRVERGGEAVDGGQRAEVGMRGAKATRH